MINKKVPDFLTLLSKNNNRFWFHENRSMYNSARAEFEIFVNIMINEIQKFDPGIQSLRAKDCIFRIFRDVRFSKDKSPYKTNFGVFFVSGGKKSGKAGYYVHVEPGNSFLGGGIYMPESNILRLVRNEIFNNIEEFKSIINEKSFQFHFKEIRGEKLISAPRGFPKEFPDIELLKFKSYTIIKPLPDETLQEEKFIDIASNIFLAMVPFNRFLNHSIENG